MRIVDEVQEFFFECMLKGWAKGAAAQPVLGKPGYKQIEFESGGWRLVDEYCTTTGSHHSAGTTTIWVAGHVAWVMQYQGWYTKEGSKVVKAALFEAYSKRLWFGGRGPAEFQMGDVQYVNESSGNFEKFDGFEAAWHGTGREDFLGTHSYRGTWFPISE